MSRVAAPRGNLARALAKVSWWGSSVINIIQGIEGGIAIAGLADLAELAELEARGAGEVSRRVTTAAGRGGARFGVAGRVRWGVPGAELVGWRATVCR